MFDYKLLKFYWRALQYRFLKKDNLEIKTMLKYIKPGDLVVDIGAYKGGYTYWMSKAAGEVGKVYAFEPQEVIYNDLFRILSSSIKNVLLEQIALSSKSGTMKLAIPGKRRDYSPGATLEVKDYEQYQTMYDVEIKTLDDYFQNINRGRLSFIKCDVEGHELDVFLGGAKTLQECKPTLIFECESRHLKNHSVYDVFNFLEQCGYEGAFFYQNKLHPLVDFQPEIHQAVAEKPEVNNFLFVHPER